ncbi:hypothetical protein VTI74DRAFT_1028 [Chaetomium olivicolor]
MEGAPFEHLIKQPRRLSLHCPRIVTVADWAEGPREPGSGGLAQWNTCSRNRSPDFFLPARRQRDNINKCCQDGAKNCTASLSPSRTRKHRSRFYGRGCPGKAQSPSMCVN